MERITNFVCRAGFAEVQTKAGWLRGYQQNDIYHFFGIPYAKAERFCPPEPADSWEGIRNAHDYGLVCTYPRMKFRIHETLLSVPQMWPDSEHCQNLNVWTPTLDPNAKKPVMVWIHGGAFSSGSAIHLTHYEGHELAHYGDVVSVSINHRLGVLGFLNLSQYGEKYKDSGNVGLLDLVEALRWVRDNIAQFGGDPDNVIIYGHSGGGGKVSALLQMPIADGLYHKAILQSGLIYNERLTWPTAEESNAQAAQLVAKAGSVDALLSMSADDLMECTVAAYSNTMFWLPTQGHGTFIGDYRAVGLREETKDIPIMLGSALCEFGQKTEWFDKSQLTDEEKLAALTRVYGDKAPAVKAAFEATYPDVNSYYAYCLDTETFRTQTIRYCDLRTEMGANAYAYLLTYEHAYSGGMMSFHGTELPFTFHNAEYAGGFLNGEESRVFGEEIFDAWIRFAYTGNPNHDKLTEWRPYTADDHACLVFGKNTFCKADHDKALLDAVLSK